MKRIFRLPLAVLLSATIMACSSDNTSEASVSSSMQPILNSSDTESAVEPELSSENNSGLSSQEPISSSKEGESSTVEDSLLQRINNQIAASKPTKIVTKQTYRNSDIGQDLTQTSTFEIEYGSRIKTKFTYSYQVLNPIGAESPIGMRTGTIYSTGADVYSVVNGELVLAEETDVVYLTAKLNLSRERYFNETEIESDYLWADVKDDNIEDVLGEDFNINSLTLEIDLYEEKLDKLRIKYKTDLGASITSTSTYSYDEITVDIPD